MVGWCCNLGVPWTRPFFPQTLLAEIMLGYGNYHRWDTHQLLATNIKIQHCVTRVILFTFVTKMSICPWSWNHKVHECFKNEFSMECETRKQRRFKSRQTVFMPTEHFKATRVTAGDGEVPNVYSYAAICCWYSPRMYFSSFFRARWCP